MLDRTLQRHTLRVMPFCPVCEDEFRPGFTWCRRCNAHLVAELPATEAPDLRPDDSETPIPGPEEADEISIGSEARGFLVQVYVGVPGAKLDLVQSLIHAAGVRLHVQTIGSGRWLVVGSLGAFSGIPTDFNAARILVAPDDVDEALGVLEDADRGQLAIGESDDRPPLGILARWGASRAARLILALFFFSVLLG
jgi:hypothetical protein